ncbi:rhomboid family intramembrane serine protease [Spirosoma flavus]
MDTTVIIIAVTVIISIMAWNNYGLMDRWVMNPYLVAKKGQYYRLLTSGFLHADWAHLLFNMLSLYFFGGYIEQIFGMLFGAVAPLYLIGFYLIGIIVSDIPTFLKHRNDSNYNSLGASGGVAAIVFAGILFQPLTKICLYFTLCVPGFIFGIIYLGYSYYESRRGSGTINHDAHLYGALFGVLFMIIIYPPALSNFFQQIASWQLF